MNGQNKPNARQKRVVGAGKGIEKRAKAWGSARSGRCRGKAPLNTSRRMRRRMPPPSWPKKRCITRRRRRRRALRGLRRAEPGPRPRIRRREASSGRPSRRHRKLRGPRREPHGLRWAPPALQPPARAGHRTPGRAARAERPWAWAGADAAESCF